MSYVDSIAGIDEETSSSNVKVRIITGSRVLRVSWESNEPLTVRAALEQASVVLNPTQSVGVNGEPADLDDELSDGDRVALAGNKDSGVAR